MILEEEFIDCPECGAAGSVVRGFCAVCALAIEESDHDEAFPGPRMLHPSIPVRFSDVIDELRTIASMATGARHLQGASVAAACRRAESLLQILRRQFRQDVTEGPSEVRVARDTDRTAMFTRRSPSGRGRFTSRG